MEEINIIGLGVAVFIVSIQYYALRTLGKITKAELDSHADTLKKYRTCLEENGELLQKENYLMKAINDSMQVTYPKGFLAQRLRIAPFKPINNKRIKRDLVDEPK